MILFIAFLLLILSLIGVISITACFLCMEDEMEANSKNLQYLQYLIQLTKIQTSSLPGLTREDRLTVQQLRAEVERTEAVYRERHRNIYDLDHDSDEDIYHLQYDSQEGEEELVMQEEELVSGRLSEVVDLRWETML